MPPRKRASSGQIAPPQIELSELQQIDQKESIVSEEYCFQQRWNEARLDGQQGEDICLEQVIAHKLHLQAAELLRAQLLDCRIENSDLANCSLEKAYLRRDAFFNSRMLGIKLIDADLEDLQVHRCNLNLARIWNSNFKQARFEQCSFQEASFDGSNLADAVFRNCDLSRADLRNAKLKGADLRGSQLQGVQISLANLVGAIVDEEQALYLMQLFGVIVRPQEV